MALEGRAYGLACAKLARDFALGLPKSALRLLAIVAMRADRSLSTHMWPGGALLICGLGSIASKPSFDNQQKPHAP